jgi:glycosyltransferase involved in cell wall biosynthesis
MKNNETLSIVICTHNRVDFLRGAIQSILEQDYPVKDYELIVVDNNSSDSTRTVVEEFTSQHAHVRYILETNIGLSNARNRGWQEARGEYVGYVDDDCKAPPEWLVVARDVINQIAPAAFGGPYFAFYNTLKPRWYRDEYGAMDLGAQAHVLDPNEYMSGGNLFFRRAVLEVLGGFDSELRMVKKPLYCGGCVPKCPIK